MGSVAQQGADPVYLSEVEGVEHCLGEGNRVPGVDHLPNMGVLPGGPSPVHVHGKCSPL